VKRANFTRDWRIKTLVPLVVVNVLAFGGLYALMYHFAVSNLVQTHLDGASMLFDELQLHFEDMMMNHTDANFQTRVARQAEAHHLHGLNIYDAAANPIAVTAAPPTGSDVDLARATLRDGSGTVQWMLRGNDDVVVFGRVIPNAQRCTGCHSPAAKNLGVMQISFDLTQGMREAKVRVRQKFVFAGIAWIAVLALLIWTARMVISRPLKKIEETIGGGSRKTQDLDELAVQVNRTLWSLIETQRKRDEDIKVHMARAEQLAALGQVAAGLTHEIKNPLSGVIAALDLLRSEKHENDEVYEQMLAELRRVTGTVDALLRLGKPQPPQRACVDMSRVVREVTSLFTARLRRAGVQLEIEISDDIPTLQLDSGLMVQLLVNLLTNAMQATDRGGSIKVLLAPFPHRDGVVLAVSDTGRGIARETLDRIFVPFFTTKEEGTGLGLAICRQIVEQHGGTIKAESEVGAGTSMIVLLPNHQSSSEDREPRTEDSNGALAVG
jgi:signal transduction histidine kinase